MTAHYIAKVVQSQYDKISIDEMLSEFSGIEKYKYGRLSDQWVNKKIENKQYNRWLHACYVLEEYLRMNFDSFEATELVEKWADTLCKVRNKLLNKHRVSGFMENQSFKGWLEDTKHIHRGRFFGYL